MPTTPTGHGTPREPLQEHCRRLADLVSWDRSVGDDTPRFGLSFRDKVDALVESARSLVAHPALSGDAELAHRLTALVAVAERAVTDPTFNRDAIANGHDVAERAEDVLDVSW